MLINTREPSRLCEKLIEHVFFNFRLWVYASVDVQLLLYDWCILSVKLDTAKANVVITNVSLMDKIFLHTDYTICHDDRL